VGLLASSPWREPSTEYQSSSSKETMCFKKLVILTLLQLRNISCTFFRFFHTHAHTHTHTHTHARTHTRTHTHARTHARTHTASHHSYTFIRPHTHTHKQTHNALLDAHSIPFISHFTRTPQHRNRPAICTSRASSRWAEVAWAGGLAAGGRVSS